MILIYRIDNRLLHGQVLEAWIPEMKINWIGVVSDEVSQDKDRQMVMTLAAPEQAKTQFLSVKDAVGAAANVDKEKNLRAILLFPRPHEVVELIEAGGAKPKEVNVGGMHYAMGRVSLGKFMTFSAEDKEALLKLVGLGVKLDARATPQDQPVDLLPILKN